MSKQPPWAAVLRGVPVGDQWRWNDPDRPSEGETCWGVLWNRNLGEIVAVQIKNGGTGRVLLLGTIRRDADRAGMLAWLERMAQDHMSQTDSLMTLAWAIDDRTTD